MRTRRQDKPVAEPVEQSAEESTPASTSPTTVVTITKIDGPIETPAARKASKLPVPLQFPLVTILSLSLSAVGYSLTHQWTKSVIATHARVLDSWVDVGVLTGWRM